MARGGISSTLAFRTRSGEASVTVSVPDDMLTSYDRGVLREWIGGQVLDKIDALHRDEARDA